jgi:hypothetical protein
LVSDTDGNVFGGFTQAEWESRILNSRDCDQSNDSLRSLLFTLRNPRGAEIRAQHGKEAVHNPLQFRMWSSISSHSCFRELQCKQREMREWVFTSRDLAVFRGRAGKARLAEVEGLSVTGSWI